MGNALNALSSVTKEDTRLYNCIKELYEQGVPFSELKALIPDMKRTREQLQIKRMLENNNEVLVSMLSKEMHYLLDAKERAEEEQFRKLDQLIRQQQNYRKESARPAAAKRLKRLLFQA
jgi:DNA-binding transcriptional MerR regulator